MMKHSARFISALDSRSNRVEAADEPPVCSYLLPIRRWEFSEPECSELTQYFRCLTRARCEVIVADGSPPSVFARHAAAWAALVRHLAVDRRFGYTNDKANGIHTGVAAAGSSKIILADDDVRYTAADIEKICALLDDYDVVRPQNYFEREKHVTARMEAARMLINRATLRTADYPGTCAFRRETMLRAGHYDGDVLFDNEEIIRHFVRTGARIAYAIDFFIRKRAPRFRKWLEQRPRQAYEDFGLRTKTALYASVVPGLVIGGLWAGVAGLLFTAAAIVLVPTAVAFVGWRRGTARCFFAKTTPLFAPLWVIERSLSTWWAFYWRLRHGGYPFGGALLTRGFGRDWIEGGKLAACASAAQHHRQ